MRILIVMALISISSTVHAALSASACTDLVVAALKTKNPNITGDVETELRAYWNLVCEALITHIQTSAVVNTTISTAIATGVQTGPSTVPVTGATVGTIN